MPAIPAAIAAVSAWTVTFAGVQIGVGAFLVNTVSSIALSALATAIRGRPDVSQPGITTQTTTAGGTVPQRLIFGRYATAGQMVAPMMVYQTDGNPNEWLVYVISLADAPVTGLGRIFVDGKALTIEGSPAASAHGDAMGATVLDTPQDSLRDKVYIRFHDGNQATADAYLRRVFGTYPERPWTADMIGKGVAYAVVTFKGKAQDSNYSGFPSVKFEVDGHKLLDPRDGQTKFTRNPAVIAYNILRGISIPGGDLWGVGATRFVNSHVIAAANLCDQLVPVPAGGTRVRYQAGLEVSVADEPHQALMEFVKAMGGDVADMGGTWLLTAGEPSGPVLSITDDDIIVTDSRSLKPYPGLDETINAIHASYPDPGQQWEAKEAVPLYNAAYEAKDGGRRLIAEVDFPAVPYAEQVRALMREMLADHRRMRTHVITLPPDALGVKLGEHIAWSSVINGYQAKLFKVAAIRIDPVSLCVALTITERDPTDYDYDAGSDGKVPTIPSSDPVVPVIGPIHGWEAFAVDAGGRPGIRMAWNPETNARAIAWTIRLGTSVVNSGTTSDLTSGGTTQTAGLRPSTTYSVTGRLVLPGRVTETITTTVTTLALGLTWDDLTGEVRDDVQSLETWANGTGGFYRDMLDEMGIVRDEVIEGQFQSFTEREKIRADIRQVEVNLDEAYAGAIDALVTRVGKTEDGLVAQADSITSVTSRTNRGTATGLLRIGTEAAPSGVQTRIGLRAEATADDATHAAALYLEANSNGTSQVGVVADRFFVASSTVTGATRKVPFVIDDGQIVMDADVWIKNLSVGTAKIAGQSVASSAFISGGTNDLTLTYVLTGLPGETYQTFIFAGNTVSTTAWLRLYVNGVERWAEQPIGGTLAMRAFGIDLGTGTHTIRVLNENPANSNSSSLAVWTRKR